MKHQITFSFKNIDIFGFGFNIDDALDNLLCELNRHYGWQNNDLDYLDYSSLEYYIVQQIIFDDIFYYKMEEIQILFNYDEKGDLKISKCYYYENPYYTYIKAISNKFFISNEYETMRREKIIIQRRKHYKYIAYNKQNKMVEKEMRQIKKKYNL